MGSHCFGLGRGALDGLLDGLPKLMLVLSQCFFLNLPFKFKIKSISNPIILKIIILLLLSLFFTFHFLLLPSPSFSSFFFSVSSFFSSAGQLLSPLSLPLSFFHFLFPLISSSSPFPPSSPFFVSSSFASAGQLLSPLSLSRLSSLVFMLGLIDLSHTAT